MKKLFVPFAAIALLASVSSCTKCYVCVDKESDYYIKTEICDKDFDKGRVSDAIEAQENLGFRCHRKTRVL